ncbi:MAG: sigma-54 dependent transcriptional regulator [Thermodesulfobacteriota bacterium]
MRILVVDDDPVQVELLTGALAAEGHEALGFTDPFRALAHLENRGADLVVTDHKMPGITGIELTRRALTIDPELLVIIVTAYSSVGDAVSAMKGGAFDYLVKPLDLEHLLLLVEKASRQRDLLRENRALKQSLAEMGRGFSLIGRSPAMLEVFSRMERVAQVNATVLITGESGTGKELVARAIHAHGSRKDGPFIAVNCAALPETLLESELFGHEKGSFTGAAARRIGKLEAAHNGTLFLDEVGELPSAVQVKLLRFLQDKIIERLGANTPITVNARLIAATNRDLSQAMTEGEFREDLFFRLNVVSIAIPPLRDRKSDLPELIRHFLADFNQAHGKAIKGFSREFYDQLIRYGFPGNVRELRNIVENAVVLCRTDTLQTEDLPEYVRKTPVSDSDDTGKPLPLILDNM